MEKPFFYHTLKVDEELCIGCSHCIDACPTEAIRVWNGKANIDENKCIDCGQCYRACPVNAIYVHDDSVSEIFKYKHRVALIPGVLLGQFPEAISPSRIYSILHKIGFTHVFEVERAVGVLKSAINDYFLDDDLEYPIISSFCPAIVRLIQVKYPSLVDNILKLSTPSDLSAAYFRQKLIDSGAEPEEIGLFYITPCAAKIAAIKSPVGEDISLVTGAINLNTIYNLIYKEIKSHDVDVVLPEESTNLYPHEVVWTLTRGEASQVKRKSLAIDGVRNVMDFLELVENEEILGFEFLECRACKEGCAGGILNAQNRFLIVESLKKRAEQYKLLDSQVIDEEIDSYKDFLKSRIALGEVVPRSMMMLDSDMAQALKKMEKAEKILKQLPSIDCGACGAPSCRALAEDIVKGNASLSHCVFIQKVMMRKGEINTETAFAILDKIWGGDRVWKGSIKRKDPESLE